jgi:hypothetical protein
MRGKQQQQQQSCRPPQTSNTTPRRRRKEVQEAVEAAVPLTMPVPVLVLGVLVVCR